jgi:quinol monooxygenase YgiN
LVILINRFKLHASGEEFERVFKESGELMRRQPGFIHYRLVRSLFSPDVYTNIAQWEDRESHDRVLQSPEFAEHIKQLGTVAAPGPELHEVVMEGDPAEVSA